MSRLLRDRRQTSIMHEGSNERTASAGLMQKRVCLRRWFAVVLLSLGVFSGRTLAAQSKPPSTHAATAVQDPAEPSPDQAEDLTDRVISEVLNPLRVGFEEHNLAKVLSVLDQENMPNYAQTRDELTALFRLYDSILFRYKILQVSSEAGGAFAVAEIDIAARASDQNRPPVQRSTQMRFQLKSSPKGWKIMGFQPADFFRYQ